jgi:hypothetical protein
MPPTTDPPAELVPALAAKRLLGLLHASKVDTVRRGCNFSPMRAIRDRYRGYFLVSRAGKGPNAPGRLEHGTAAAVRN